MTDDVYRPRNSVTRNDVDSQENPMDKIQQIQNAVANETGQENSQAFNAEESPFQVTGNIPPAFKQAIEGKRKQPIEEPINEENFQTFESPPERSPNPSPQISPRRSQGSDELEDLLQQLADNHHWEDFTFPSKSKFYDNIPESIHVRPMTGEEEQVLATPRFVKKGLAIDMIFKQCIRENIDPSTLLSIDRNHLLIYLRGISYTPEYDVEIKCPSCSLKYSTIIDLNMLEIEECPENFDIDSLQGTLPNSGFNYTYRLSTGDDEKEINRYREKRIQQWGDQSEDDTLLYRTAMLLENIENVHRKKELTHLLKKLPINDVAHLRNVINDPPFGVDTEVPQICPSCTEEFAIDLPLEANFFFPKKRQEAPQA